MDITTDNEITTTDLSKFGYRELHLAKELLQALEDQGLPEDFNDDRLTIMFNMHSGNVFFTNSDYQVAMLNGDKLESFYNCPNCGNEGFAEDILTKSGKCKECKKQIIY
jgi:DNA-directed RNA polymerase subunit RPC12/RpoP